jgi:hypothetical protein
VSFDRRLSQQQRARKGVSGARRTGGAESRHDDPGRGNSAGRGIFVPPALRAESSSNDNTDKPERAVQEARLEYLQWLERHPPQ